MEKNMPKKRKTRKRYVWAGSECGQVRTWALMVEPGEKASLVQPLNAYGQPVGEPRRVPNSAITPDRGGA